MPRRPWRFRQCPLCPTIFAGGQLKPAQYGAGHWHLQGGSMRICPACGHRAPTQEFVIVSQHPVTAR